MSRMASVLLIPQDFQTYDRTDMFFPSGTVASNVSLGELASPTLGVVPNVHSIPVIYQIPKANMRTHSPIGMVTPNVTIGGLV